MNEKGPTMPSGHSLQTFLRAFQPRIHEFRTGRAGRSFSMAGVNGRGGLGALD